MFHDELLEMYKKLFIWITILVKHSSLGSHFNPFDKDEPKLYHPQVG